MSRWRLVLIWLVATLLATTLTWQIVSAADDQLNARPLAALEVTSTGSSTPGSTVPATSAGAPGSPVSPPSAGATSSTAPQPASGTQATAGQSPGSTAPWKVETISSAGGTVVVAYRPGEVRYESASPAAGFAVEVKQQGPVVVEVDFEAATIKIDVKAQWVNGALDVEIDTESGEGGDD